MAKKKIEVEEQMTPMALPSDNIMSFDGADEFDAAPGAAFLASVAKDVVYATTLPEKPKVDVNKVLFEMIALLGTVEVFESQARIIRAVAAYYNLLEEMGS